MALLYFVYALDDWLGILAYQYRYLGFSVFSSSAVAASWLAKSKKSAVITGLVAFALLLSPFVVGEPSSRILRRVLIDVQTGMHGDEVEEMVRNAYGDSGYVMPEMKRDENRIHVSLLTQEPGDCTAAIFHLANGVVVRDEFSAD